MSPLDPHSRTALSNRWTAHDWKTLISGLVMLVAVIYSLDNLVGPAYLDAGALRWDIGQHLLDLVPDFSFKPWLPLLLFVPLVGFSIDCHVCLGNLVRRALDRRNGRNAWQTPYPAGSAA